MTWLLIQNQFITGESSDDMYLIKTLTKKEFYWGYYHGTEENRWIHGSLNTYNPYCWGNWGYEPRYPGHIYKKSLHGIKNNQLKRSGFYELVRKK